MAEKKKATAAEIAEKEAAKKAAEEKRMNGDDWTHLSDPDREGEVYIMEEEGDSVEGIYCGPGRVIGDGADAIGTHMIYDQEEEVMRIIPAHAVLGSLSELLEGETLVRVTYLGKKESKQSGRTYRDYRIQYKGSDVKLVRGLDYAVKNV